MAKGPTNSALSDPISGAFQMADRHQVQMIDLRLADLSGRWRHVTLPASRLTRELFQQGAELDGSISGKVVADSSRLLLMPDPATVALDPFCEVPTLSMIASVSDAVTGRPSPWCPRALAARAEEHLRSTGIADRALMRPGFEFHVFDSVRHQCEVNYCFYNVDSSEGPWNSGSEREASGLAALGLPPYRGNQAIPPSDRLYNLRSEMAALIETAGITVRHHRHEGDPGQCAIATRPATLLQAADRALQVRYLIRMAADRAGKVATFMPKPLHDGRGSGMPVRQELFRGEDTIFLDSSERTGLSQTALHYIGGLLDHGPALVALTCPSTNSYKRLVPGFQAPVHLAFGRDGHALTVRIPESGSGTRTGQVEFQPSDASGNVYLGLAAMLLAGLDGIRKRIDPREEGFGPVEAPLESIPAEDRARVRLLPLDLEQALLRPGEGPPVPS